VVDLSEREAPKTIEALWKSLPIRGKLLHARYSGQEVLIEQRGDKVIRSPKENQVYNVLPGDVGYWYSWFGDDRYLRDVPEFSEIVMIYGRYTALRSVYGPAAMNLIGTVEGNLKDFAEACGRIHSEGPTTVVLRKLR